LILLAFFIAKITCKSQARSAFGHDYLSKKHMLTDVSAIIGSLDIVSIDGNGLRLMPLSF